MFNDHMDNDIFNMIQNLSEREIKLSKKLQSDRDCATRVKKCTGQQPITSLRPTLLKEGLGITVDITDCLTEVEDYEEKLTILSIIQRILARPDLKCQTEKLIIRNYGDLHLGGAQLIASCISIYIFKAEISHYV